MVIVGLGSNRGDSQQLVRDGLRALAPFANTHVVASSLWRTSPVDCPPGSEPFINAAAAFEAAPGLSPDRLLRELKAIERRFGRQANTVRHAPRELDLDLLVYDELVLSAPHLELPHPRAHGRRFVLEPVAEVAPDLLWPGLNRTVRELLDEWRGDELVERLERPS